MIRAQGLGKTYRGAVAPTLRGVDLAVGRGQLAAILGLSGAGKSTLLRGLVGLESFDEGYVRVGDRRLDAAGARVRNPTLQGLVGLVFQSFELFPHLSVLDNCVLAPRRVAGLPRAEAEARARRLLDELGLGDKVAAIPEHLSGGQRQRAAIARALAMAPQVLLYDEPTSALDPTLRREVHETLREVRRRGVTQLVVTHDVSLAHTTCDLVFVLDRGAIAEAGSPEEVLERPRSEAGRRLAEGLARR